MSLPHIHYRVIGQDDYMLIIDVDPDGNFNIDYGDYTSRKPVRGAIDVGQRERLMAALDAIGESREHQAPEGTTGFMAELTVGEGPTVRHFRFWEGALNDEPDLKGLVRELEVLG